MTQENYEEENDMAGGFEHTLSSIVSGSAESAEEMVLDFGLKVSVKP